LLLPFLYHVRFAYSACFSIFHLREGIDPVASFIAKGALVKFSFRHDPVTFELKILITAGHFAKPMRSPTIELPLNFDINLHIYGREGVDYLPVGCLVRIVIPLDRVEGREIKSLKRVGMHRLCFWMLWLQGLLFL